MNSDMHRSGTAFTNIPATRGAYVLAIALTVPLHLSLPGRRPALLNPGRYLYCGSAKGPGGLRARLARHARCRKNVHWHVDRLTRAGTIIGAWVFPDGDECDLVAMLSECPVAMRGFGSSDCAQCASHLLCWPAEARLPLHRGLFFCAPSENESCSLEPPKD